MPASTCVKHNKPYPCGPCRKESALRPAQVAPLPLAQLEPTAAEVRVIAEDFTLSTVYPSVGTKDEFGRPAKPKRVDSPWARAGAKKRKEEKNRRPPTAREQFSLTRRDVAALLDLEGVDSSVKPFEATHLRDLAAGNVSTTELAERLHLSETSVEVLITGWETAVIRKALLLGAKLESSDKRNGLGTFEFDIDRDHDAQLAAIAQSGGGAIDGSVISRGHGERLDSFERTGGISRSSKSNSDLGSEGYVEDSYDEHSGDEIRRGE